MTPRQTLTESLTVACRMILLQYCTLVTAAAVVSDECGYSLAS